MAEYDLDGWRVPDLTDPGRTQLPRDAGEEPVRRRMALIRGACDAAATSTERRVARDGCRFTAFGGRSARGMRMRRPMASSAPAVEPFVYEGCRSDDLRARPDRRSAGCVARYRRHARAGALDAEQQRHGRARRSDARRSRRPASFPARSCTRRSRSPRRRVARLRGAATPTASSRSAAARPPGSARRSRSAPTRRSS